MPGKQLYRQFHRLILALVFFLPQHSVYAAQSEGAPQKVECITGGVGQTERSAMLANQEKYNFWLTVAAKPSGAYLSDVYVRILNAASKTAVLECRMDGPWLFATLPSGRYEVEAIHRENTAYPEQTEKKITTIRPGARRQVVLYFDLPDLFRLEDEISSAAKPAQSRK